MRRLSRIAMTTVAFATAVALTACAPGGTVSEPSSPASPSPSLSRFEPVPTASGEAAEVPASHWDAIVADLASRGVTGEPQLVSAENVTWPNAALGCPKPGMSYTQALIDGMRVVVTVDGVVYDYRFGTEATPLLCER
ncbi:hypothetical protein GCM10010460_24300 [Microbacterium terrae]|uniref:Uncharacterized protein n=1 Tax=Microbacterium terrae TaxID=69369 RepID=A0A0M2H3B6_9MICO|nr:hypothetical protein RS81_01461 [Microbacterium terrae]GLJ97685.1 hypothetical protein GCM10017594_08820 [Microbacterium terrae]